MTFYSSSSSPSPRRSCAPLSHSATAAAVVVHHLLTHVFLLLTITFTPLSPFRNSNASTLSSSSSVYLPSVFSLASAVFMITNSRGSGSDSPRWYDFDAFRYVFAANAIVAVYSLFEMIASVWEISREVTLFPEILQVWFDFGHDQAFAYLLLSADSAGTALAITLKGTDTCKVTSAFCVQSTISIALGFAGFLFLGLSSLLSGFRVVCFVINGSRFHF